VCSDPTPNLFCALEIRWVDPNNLTFRSVAWSLSKIWWYSALIAGASQALISSLEYRQHSPDFYFLIRAREMYGVSYLPDFSSAEVFLTSDF